MATWTRNYTGGSYAGNWIAHLDYWVNSQDTNANTSNIGLALYTYSTSGVYSQSGTFVGRLYVNGGEVASWSGSKSISNGSQQLVSWSGNVGHDVNGNLTISVGDYINAPVNEAAAASISWGLPRIALAPGIAGIVADTIKPQSARLGVEITGHGHGTSTTMRIYYRKVGTSTWSQTADQGDAAGYNYWTVTGLKPGTSYEYFARVWNNNGDTRDSGTSTFKTKALSGMLPVMVALAS